jgi:hypothetical protein
MLEIKAQITKMLLLAVPCRAVPCRGSLAHRFRLEEVGMNQGMTSFSLFNDNFTLLNAELNAKR